MKKIIFSVMLNKMSLLLTLAVDIPIQKIKYFEFGKTAIVCRYVMSEFKESSVHLSRGSFKQMYELNVTSLRSFYTINLREHLKYNIIRT